MDSATAASLNGVREARMRSAGAPEAKARAVVEPMEEGETPVMRTGKDQWLVASGNGASGIGVLGNGASGNGASERMSTHQFCP
jgi:hypothetical protein